MSDFERITPSRLAEAFGVSWEAAQKAQDQLGWMYRQRASATETVVVSYEDAERIVRDRLDEITVDDNSRCHWAEVANAQTHILGELRAAATTHEDRPDVTDTRWAVNVLLETIAAKFEANPTFDLWRSDAAALVRSFKHDLATPRVLAKDGQ